MRFVPIETARLRIRALQSEDTEALLAYRRHPEVVRMHGWSGYRRTDATGLIKMMQRSTPGVPGEWFQFAIALLDDDSIIGDCGLCLGFVSPSSAEIGYTIAPDHQRQGYGCEAVSALIGYAFDKWGLTEITAVTACDNERSMRLLIRLGFRQGRTVTNVRACGRRRREFSFSLSPSDFRR